jgi:hypothetical protein
MVSARKSPSADVAISNAKEGRDFDQHAFSAEGHRDFGKRDWISWLRSDANESRGRRFSPSQGMHPSGDTRTFFSFTVAGPRRIHTGFPMSRCYSVFRTGRSLVSQVRHVKVGVVFELEDGRIL